MAIAVQLKGLEYYYYYYYYYYIRYKAYQLHNAG
jgi:hypothetical protein